MYKAVYNYLIDTNPSIIDKMPLMEEAIINLGKNIDDIKFFSENQQESRKGYRATKNVTKEDVVNTIFVLSGQVKSYAVNTNNLILKNQVNYTISDLRAMADGNLQVNAGIILEKAQENVANLASYGVTPASLIDVQDLLNLFSIQLAQPRNAISTKVEDTKLLKIAFAKTDTLLEDSMDTLVIIVKLSDMEFFDIYKNNRKIIGPGYFPLAMRAFVTNIDQEPLEKVKATIEGNKTIYRTAKKGSFNIKSLPEGMHKITFSLPGYNSQTLNIPIIKGKRTDIRVVLLQQD